jgi:acetolactate synthase small subunit
VHHTHQLEMTVAGTPLVLDRIVTLCRARQCTIVALRFEAADRHRPGRVLATVRAEARQVRLVAQRLAALPGVLAVAQWGSSPVAAGGRDSSASDVIASRPRAAASSTSVASSWERA